MGSRFLIHPAESRSSHKPLMPLEEARPVLWVERPPGRVAGPLSGTTLPSTLPPGGRTVRDRTGTIDDSSPA